MQALLVWADVASRAVLWGLGALSVSSIAVIVERWWYFRKHRVDARALGNRLGQCLGTGDVAGAQRVCDAPEFSNSAVAQVLAEALDWYEAGPDSFREILDKATRERRPELESGLVFLGTVGNNAPFVGLFGTVLGIVTAFHALGDTAARAGSMDNVMTAIGEALIATAIGILVALPAVVGFNIFQKRCADIEDTIASLGSLVVAELKRTNGSLMRQGEATPLGRLTHQAPAEVGV